jgi:hypothetical protein
MRKTTTSPFTSDTVESIAAGVAHDPNAPGSEWYVRMGTVWQATHPVLLAHPDWFVELGKGQTTPRSRCSSGIAMADITVYKRATVTYFSTASGVGGVKQDEVRAARTRS